MVATEKGGGEVQIDMKCTARKIKVLIFFLSNFHITMPCCIPVIKLYKFVYCKFNISTKSGF
jgi:hypothetical protein